MPRRRLAPLALMALLLGACGGSGDGPAAPRPDTAAPAEAPAPAAPAAAVTILRPRRGTTVRGRAAQAGRVAVALTVTGRAAAQQVVHVDGRCGARSCSRMALAGGDGRWSARLRLVLPAGRRRATLTADYALADDAARRARVTVAVQAPPNRPAAAPRPTTAPEPPRPASHDLTLIGDSLAVGVQDLLPAALPGWRVRVDGRISRPLADGLAILQSTELPASGVLALSLFTNDDPAHTSALEAGVQTTLARVGAGGCVVWATIVAPPIDGVAYDHANALLRRLARQEPRLLLVDWAHTVAARPGLVGRDGVHPTPAGYEARAQEYAAAAKRCAG